MRGTTAVTHAHPAARPAVKGARERAPLVSLAARLINIQTTIRWSPRVVPHNLSLVPWLSSSCPFELGFTAPRTTVQTGYLFPALSLCH